MNEKGPEKPTPVIIRSVTKRTPISFLGLMMSPAAYRILEREDYWHLTELSRMTESEILQIRGVSYKILGEYRTILSYAGLAFKKS